MNRNGYSYIFLVIEKGMCSGLLVTQVRPEAVLLGSLTQ